MATVNALKSLRELIESAGGGAQLAATKSASTLSEPGSRGGETTMPIKSVDDGLIRETTGARYAENTADAKDATGSIGTDSTSDQQGEGSNPATTLMNMTAKATGEDSSTEDAYKSTKDDPGTTAPMTTEDGKKYGSYGMAELAHEFGKCANAILAQIGSGVLTKSATATPAAPAAPAQLTPEQAAAVEAGYKAAESLGGQPQDTDVAEAFIYQTIKEAVDHAELVTTYFRELEKAAADPADSGNAEDHSKGEDSSSGAGAGPSPAGPVGGGGGGGAPADPMGGGGGGGGGDLAEVAAILQSLPPEQLQQLMAMVSAGGGGGGMGGAMGGGAPPPADPTGTLSDAMAEGGQTPETLEAMAPKVASESNRQVLRKIAQDVRNYRNSGAWRFEPAKTAAERMRRDEMRRVLQELMR